MIPGDCAPFDGDRLKAPLRVSAEWCFRALLLPVLRTVHLLLQLKQMQVRKLALHRKERAVEREVGLDDNTRHTLVAEENRRGVTVTLGQQTT